MDYKNLYYDISMFLFYFYNFDKDNIYLLGFVNVKIIGVKYFN